MTSHHPQISVIMPVFNEDKYLKYSVESVLKQSFENFEFIIVDDRSSDQSWKILTDYAKNDKRIKLFRSHRHQGVGASLNLAIKNSTAPYLARMDADDIMAPSRLKEQFEFLEKHKDMVAVGSWMYEIDKDNQIIGKRIAPASHRQIYEMMFWGMGIQNPSLMINRQLLPKNFPWCKTAGILDDLDLLFKLLPFGKFANIDKYLMFYRIHDKNLSLKNIKKTFKEALRIRKTATKKYDYRPTARARAILTVQKIFISLIPERYLYFFYKLFKIISFSK